MRKLAGYFLPWDAYWQLSDQARPTRIATGPLQRYPLDLTPRLHTGHFARFDESGLPRRLGEGGRLLYNYTTLCAFAVAH